MKKLTIFTILIIAILFFISCQEKNVVKQTTNHLDRGFRLLDAGHTDSALDHFRHVLSERKDARATMGIGMVYLAKGDNYRAEQYLRKALSKDESLTQIYGLLGQVYIEKGNEDKAMEYFAKCPPDDPHYAELHYRLGRRHLNEGEYDLADEEFDKALEHPNFWGGHWGKGYLAQRNDNYQASLEYYRKAAALQAKPDALFGLAEALMALENYQQAYFYYLRYLATAPEGINAPIAEQNIQQLRNQIGEIETVEKVQFNLDDDDNVKVCVFDEQGAHLRDLFSGFLCGGNYEMGWDGTDQTGKFAEGDIFFGIVTCGDSTFIQKIAPGGN
ncbi:MAG: tetratricopeptide repeat protein [Candidatus Zixiibacteriota bacterium]